MREATKSPSVQRGFLVLAWSVSCQYQVEVSSWPAGAPPPLPNFFFGGGDAPVKSHVLVVQVIALISIHTALLQKPTLWIQHRSQHVRIQLAGKCIAEIRKAVRIYKEEGIPSIHSGIGRRKNFSTTTTLFRTTLPTPSTHVRAFERLSY